MTERKAFPLQQLVDYPPSADDLPTEIIKFAYADGPAVQRPMPGIRVAASPKFFPLRSSSRLLKKTKLQPAQSQSTDVSQQAPAKEATAMPPQPGNTLHLPVAGDIVEEALYNKYKADLWRHRAQKHGHIALTSTTEVPVAPKAELNVMPLVKMRKCHCPAAHAGLKVMAV